MLVALGAAWILATASSATADPPTELVFCQLGTGTPPPPGPPPETPPRDAVATALRSVHGAVRACAPDESGVVTVEIDFSGRSGRVKRARVDATFSTGPVRRCISRAVRRARVPRFRRPSFAVRFPFRLGS